MLKLVPFFFVACASAQLFGFGPGFGTDPGFSSGSNSDFGGERSTGGIAPTVGTQFDPASAKEFQERNGLPENPNSVFPAQALLPASNFIASGPSNRIATPVMENSEGRASLFQQLRGYGPPSRFFGSGNGINSLVFG